jgi:hypothetical protein
MQSPVSLAISPDGDNVYVADESGGGDGQVDVLTRNPQTGALSDSSCVDDLPEEGPPEEGEEAGEEPAEEESKGSDPCAHVAGLEDVSAVAVSGDGTAVYAIGATSAVVFSRDRTTGALTEVSCAANEDKRCTSFTPIDEVEGIAVSTDGREVYVAAGASDSVMAFGLGSTIATGQAAASDDGRLRVRLDCPSELRRACAGRLELMRTTTTRKGPRHHRRVQRRVVGSSAHFHIDPGHRAAVTVVLSASSRRLLKSRRRLALTTVVHADPLAGGSGYGRRLSVRLARRG